jgi:hypothetical protein
MASLVPMGTSIASQRHLQETQRLEQEAREWADKVQSKQSLDKSGLLREFEAQQLAAAKLLVDRRQEEERAVQERMFRKQQEAAEERDAQARETAERLAHTKRCGALSDQEALFRRQIEADQSRESERLHSRALEEHQRAKGDQERDRFLRQRSDAALRMAGDCQSARLAMSRSWSAEAEVAPCLVTQEAAGREAIVDDYNAAHETLAAQWEAQRTAASRVVAWKADGCYPVCGACQAAFGLFRRRHHCRWCGEVVCWRCSRFTEPQSSPPHPLHGLPAAAASSSAAAPERWCHRCLADPDRLVTEWLIHDLGPGPPRPDHRVDEDDWVCLLDPTEPDFRTQGLGT